MNQYQHQWRDGRSTTLPNGKVVCVGKNYADHIAEMQSETPARPVLFLKPTTALCSADQPIKISHLSHLGAVHHELEITILIGQQLDTKNRDYSSAIAGLGLGIDLTLRDLQSELKQQGLPWERSKSFDGSCALSNFIPYTDELVLDDLNLMLTINGKLRQSSNSKLMLNPIDTLLSEISEVFTLLPGDVVMTGTPAGVGPLTPGDVLSGQLNNDELFGKTPVV